MLRSFVSCRVLFCTTWASSEEGVVGTVSRDMSRTMSRAVCVMPLHRCQNGGASTKRLGGEVECPSTGEGYF